MELRYLSGFKSHLETEARQGALPKGQNSPQKAPFDLYPEQINGTAFTTPRAQNLKSWLYKISPSVQQGLFEEVGHATWFSQPKPNTIQKTPQALRFNPYPLARTKIDFVDSLYTYAMNGDPALNSGCAIHLYACNQNMSNRFLYNADAEMMIVPETGSLRILTEMGVLEVSPLMIAVIPRGLKFKVELIKDKLNDAEARGYVCENFGTSFNLPELGPIGANGLAHPRDFETPVAWYEDLAGDFELLARYQGSLWRAPLTHSPLNTVAWHGNYAPYRYDLRKFNTINTVSYDHPDPSIFTVLTSASAVPGTANIDFVIFPPRWMVAENTFRPPYYHRNVMSEFMGLIQGQYDAKPEGFLPGGASIHNCMTGHGPDRDAFNKGTNAPLAPERYQNTMAFMWESNLAFYPTQQAIKQHVDSTYIKGWQALEKKFKS